MIPRQELVVRFDPKYFPFLKQAMEQIYHLINDIGMKVGIAYVRDEVTFEYYSFSFSIGTDQ